MLAQQVIWMTIHMVTVVVVVKIFNKDYFDAKILLALWILLWLFGLGLGAPLHFFILIGVSITVVLAPILFQSFPFTVAMVDLLDKTKF